MLIDIATESIEFQYTSPLRGALETTIKELRSKPKLTSRDLADSSLSESVHKYTGMSVVFEYVTMMGWAAYVTAPPSLDKNNPLLPPSIAARITNADLYKQIEDSGKVLEGTIDRKKGKVGGVFSKITSKLVFGKHIITHSGKLTVEETAAIILHELGHLYTYYEYLSTTVQTTNILRAVGSDAYGRLPTKERVKLLHEVDSAAGIKIPDKELVANGSSEMISMIVIRESVNKKRSEMNCDYYDVRSYEYLSDQYAARHGAASSLASALNKLGKGVGSIHARGSARHFFTELLSFIFYAFGGTTGAVFFVQMLLLHACTEQRYDSPVERTEKLREQLIAQLRDKEITDDRRKKVLEEIEVIDELLTTIRNRKSIVEMFWDNVLPYGRRNTATSKLQRNLENLAYNEFYHKSAQLRAEK